MIVADGTIFAAALTGKPPGLAPLFNDLWKRRRVGTPPVVLAELLSVEREAHRAERLRHWALNTPPFTTDADAWTAAGDIVARLADAEIALPLVEAFAMAVCVREAAELWSLNPVFDQACELIPVRRFKPGGL